MSLSHVRVALQDEHGDDSLSRHDHYVGVGHGAVDYGRSQIHGDEVKLRHCRETRVWSVYAELHSQCVCDLT